MPGPHGLKACFLAVEAAGGAGEFQPAHAGDLHDRAVGREISLEADDTAGGQNRLVGRAHHVLGVIPFHALEVFRHGAAGDGHAVAVHETVIEQRLHQKRDAAGFEHVLGDVSAARLEIGDVRRTLHDGGDVEEIELNAAFVGDRRQMQRTIGRAAGRSDDGGGVFKRLARNDVARADAAAQELHDLFAGGGAELVADLVRRGRAGRVRQRQANRFGNCRHGVGGKLGAAGAGRRTGNLLQFLEIVVGHLADRVLADGLEEILDRDRVAAEGAGQDRAAIDEDRRHVEPAHRHHHARQRLVAAGKSDQRVIGMAAYRELD
jgi:hypothetical protein